MRVSRRHVHNVQHATAAAILAAALAQIQILCGKGASHETIWQIAEAAIEKARSRH